MLEAWCALCLLHSLICASSALVFASDRAVTRCALNFALLREIGQQHRREQRNDGKNYQYFDERRHTQMRFNQNNGSGCVLRRSRLFEAAAS